MHRNRVIVAAIFLPLFVLLIKFLPAWVFILLVLGGILAAQTEFYRMCFSNGNRRLILTGLFGSTVIWGGFVFGNPGVNLGLLTAAVLCFLIICLWAFKDLSRVLPEGALGLLGVMYVGWLLSHLVLLREFPGGENIILFLFLVNWTGDSGAYYVGKGLGRNKLAPRISPNKTIEGAFGGVAASLAAAWLGQSLLLPFLSLNDVVILGLAMGVLGILGDLTESVFKRSAGVKDSGGLIPAHGGILDKLDGLIFNAPVLYYYFSWFLGLGKDYWV
ncbi:MAG TPA: phosphatidate cytidylyltransferase [Nitrospiria bacterium]